MQQYSWYQEIQGKENNSKWLPKLQGNIFLLELSEENKDKNHLWIKIFSEKFWLKDKWFCFIVLQGKKKSDFIKHTEKSHPFHTYPH